ncbi:MAG: N-acetylmuramic acid 6-phosphate etherase [Micrococcaceae bacterium]
MSKDKDLRSQLETMSTESVNEDFSKIDQMDTEEAAYLMNKSDAEVPEAIKKVVPQIAAAVDGITERMEKGGRLIYIGSGTAGRLGVLDASECPPTFNTDPSQVVGVISGGNIALTNAVEGAEDDRDLAVEDLEKLNITELDTVCGISASGRTPYACSGVEYAKKKGAMTIGLSCNANSELASLADHGLEVVVGPEFVAGSTRLKSGTAQKLVCNMLSTLTMVKLGKTYGNLMVDVRSSNEKLVARSWRIVKKATDAPDEEVDEAMKTHDGDVKASILSIISGANKEDVQTALQNSNGRLRQAIDSLNN